MEVNQIVLGDCQKVLGEVVDNSVDQIVTDPPYGYCFMGKDWDKAVPCVAIWKECLRVLKPGAFAFVMSSPRADVLSHMIVNLSDAGFRTDFTPIYWAYASGFPKAMNIGKAVDKRHGLERENTGVLMQGHSEGRNRTFGTNGNIYSQASDSKAFVTLPASEAAMLLDGSYGGFQPKPAVEVIIVAMKPLGEKTFVDQALKNGKGVTWLDNCRIPFAENGDKWNKANYPHKTEGYISSSYNIDYSRETMTNKQGRFPANLLVSDDILNDGTIEKSTGHFNAHVSVSDNIYGRYDAREQADRKLEDKGSFSRYFSLDTWFQKTIKKLPLEVQKTFPFLIEPKASKAERNKNLDALPLVESGHIASKTGGGGGWKSDAIKNPNLPRKNNHPTVKPLDLMTYLITLGSRSNDLVLDPFCGSGTTCLAAKMLGRCFLGIEINEEYVKLAETRVHSHRTLGEFEIMPFNSEIEKNNNLPISKP